MSGASPGAASSHLAHLVLALRRDLRATPQMAGEVPIYVLEDPVSGQFFRVGQAEYQFLRHLDGKRTAAAALECTRAAGEGQALSDAQAWGACQWLLQFGLAQLPPQGRSGPPAGAVPATFQWSQIVAFRLPLCHPDRLLGRALPWLGWLAAPMLAAATLPLVLLGSLILLLRWSEFWESSQGILAPDEWLASLGAWLLLKVMHEFAHGLVCRRYGGNVREAGVYFLMLAPIPYVDVTSAWRFRSKWQRIHVAAAGMLLEALAAIIAVAIWCFSDQPELRQWCARFIWAATATTVLFNANPLMRFDGYYMLMDWCGIPNLYTLARRYAARWVSRWLRGGQGIAPGERPSASRWLGWYGVATWCWGLSATATIVISAAWLWHGAGLILAVIAVGSWWGVPLWRWLQLTRSHWRSEALFRRRLSLALAGGATALAAVLTLIPWSAPRVAYGIVDFAPLVAVRAATPGLVEIVFVSQGERVEVGAPLARLQNDQVVLELRQLELACEQAELRQVSLQQRGELAASTAEQVQLDSLRKQLAEKSRQVEELLLRAPMAGTVIGRQLSSLRGTYLTAGSELCAIGNDREKEIRISIHQNDLSDFQRHAGDMVQVRFPGQFHQPLRLADIQPRASLTPLHTALCAPCGGPLSVRPVTPEPGREEAYELLEPRFEGRVELAGELGERVWAGQRCRVLLQGEARSLGEHLLKLFQRQLLFASRRDRET